ncbi:PDZ domain-containing protein [Ectothiorhodospira sp. PHS-1]|uniref:PDZ domain-containing protein n=1 Tax=Ectothiorhodospira sp. PHS-1 TaxID=519989 RepID=UPI00058FCE66|nr:PDZ domain-containing protein [Ectothiorhodospira sp. PHS-1]
MVHVKFQRIRLPALAPMQVLLAGALLLVAAVVLAAWNATRFAWLGLEFQPEGERGLRVEAVHPAGPAAGLLRPGDVVRAVLREGETLSLEGFNPALGPHVLPTFDGYNRYLEFQDRLAAALNDGVVTLLLEDGRKLEIEPRTERPLQALPLDFWLFHLFGATACLIGLFVWVFRRSEMAAALLALSGGGFFAATWQHSLWLVRELALPRSLFELLLIGNHIALSVLLGALLALLACYPRRLGRGRWVMIGIAAGIVAVQVNELLQLADWPMHTFCMPLLLYYLGAWSWPSCSGDSRRVIRWIGPPSLGVSVGVP